MSAGVNLNDLIDEIAGRVADSIAARQSELRPSTDASPWLTTEEAAAYCKISQEGIRGSEKRGQLRAHRSESGRVRYRREDLDAFLRAEAA